jgi:SMODS and SLOG-associating 2TM effector domain 1
MRAEPYDRSPEQATAHFAENLRAILNDNTVLNKIIFLDGGDEITDRMAAIRKLPIADRKKLYEKLRINDQLNWYRSKATTNDTSSKKWYAFLVGLQVLAIVLAIGRIVYPDISLWPTDVFATAASCVMAWLQTKRFQELAASYSLTANDIGLLKIKLADASTESKLSAFVGDAENAFSREHTQWRARRDVE